MSRKSGLAASATLSKLSSIDCIASFLLGCAIFLALAVLSTASSFANMFLKSIIFPKFVYLLRYVVESTSNTVI